MAIDFYLKTEREWQSRTLENLTSLSFNDFFHYTAVADGIDLSQGFINKLQSKGDAT